MRSKFTEAFDSLKSNEEIKSQRVQRVLLAQSVVKNEKIASKKGRLSMKHFFKSKRGVALLTAAVVVISTAVVTVSAALNLFGGGLQNIESLIKDTFVDMDGVAAFAVWNAPDDSSDSPYITAVAQVNASLPLAEQTENGITSENDSSLPEGWDEDLYDWESDYDWDPTKANVLIAIGEDGKINEVVYERTNDRGQVRQDALGNAAAVYVSNGFTYVMYVNDFEWEFWKRINFAQEMRGPNGFHCHHESMQTVVIHNATGKVFALKDLIPQVNERSGSMNYTMQVKPFKEDFLYLSPMYGDGIDQWYQVVYDETNETVRYEYMIPDDEEVQQQLTLTYNVRSVRRDKYGQIYLLMGDNGSLMTVSPRVSSGIVDLPDYTLYGNKLVFSTTNGMMFGTDGRTYAFHEGKLKVFGENFTLSPVEAGTEVAFEGIADDFHGRESSIHDGIAYKLIDGYLYSMFGEVWKVDDDGTMHACERLEGSFPRYSDDGYLIGGEIIAFVDTKLTDNGQASINGRMVKISFDSANGAPRAVITHIINASEISVQNHRMVVEQNVEPYSFTRGDTKYFLLTVQDGAPIVEYFAYGYDGGVLGLTKPITEPLMLS